MKQFFITETTTKDNLIHQGIYFEPAGKSKIAILWVHGLTDNFYGDHVLLDTLAHACGQHGWGVAAFNNRGHDIVASLTKLDTTKPKGCTHFTGGAGVEKFEECIFDIRAGVDYLEKQGFHEIILAGISTGANKVCYYAGTQKDQRVAVVILASPISDVAIKKKELGARYQATINKAQVLVKSGKGDKLVEGFDYMPITPKRFLSLYQENSAEDIFPYYQKQPVFKTLSNITKPLMIVMGEVDEYSDRPVGEIVKVFETQQKSKNFRTVIIPKSFHSFTGKEKEIAKVIAGWIKTLLP